MDSSIARAGAFAAIAKYGTDHAPRAMRAAKWNKLLREVDPFGSLPIAEREARRMRSSAAA